MIFEEISVAWLENQVAKVTIGVDCCVKRRSTKS